MPVAKSIILKDENNTQLLPKTRSPLVIRNNNNDVEESLTRAAYAGDFVGDVIYDYDGIVVDLSDYAKKNSPVFTGVPTAPTAASGTNTNQIATTAFVQSAVSGLTPGGGGEANVIEGVSFNGVVAPIANKIANIIAEVGEDNVIESVKVNGVAQTVTHKAVDITVPTKVSDLTNDSGFTSNTGTITGITMNGVNKGTSGVVNLGSVITSETQLSKETAAGTGNAITDLSVSGHQITITRGKTFLESYTETDPIFQASPAAGITASDITAWNNVAEHSGTITSVKMNGETIASAGEADLGTVITSETQLSKGTTTGLGNAVTDISVSGHQITLTKNKTFLESFTETDPVFLASAASGITSSDITNWNSKTSNVGTITGITMNGASKGTSGVVDLGTVITSETSLSKGTTTGSGNAVTDISVSGHKITLTKGKTFLESFTETDPVFLASPAAGISANDIELWNNVASTSGTITSVKMNGTTIASAGEADLGTVITSETPLSIGTTTGNGNAITGITVSGHTINLAKSSTFLTSFTETDPVFSASAAAGITSSDITNWNGKTSNIGTVTGVKMNGTTNNPTFGIVDLGTVITSETSLSKGTTTGSGNAVTDLSVSGHSITLTKGKTFLESETDPVFSASAAAGITASDITNWNGKTSNLGTLTGVTFNGTSATVTNGVAAITASIPAEVTESTVSGWGFTKNTGTLTGVKVNGSNASVTSGIADIGTVVTSETNLSKGSTTGAGNAVTDITVNGHQITLTKGATFLTSFTETDPVFTASVAHGITSSDVSSWNAKQKAITVSSSAPTASDGSDGDIWMVVT